jgi:diguanylate cyclase
MGSTVLLEHRRRTITNSISRLPVREVAIAAVFFLGALAAIVVTRAAGSAALIWPPDSLAAALLVRSQRVRWVWAASVLFCAGVSADMLGAGDSFRLAAGMVGVNLLEVGLTVWLLRTRLRFPVPNITASQGMQMCALFAFGIPALTAVLGGMTVHTGLGTAVWPAMRDWWLACAIGACLFAPPIYLFSVTAARRLASKRFLAENLALTLTCLIGCYGAIRFVAFPFVVVAVPLILAAFRVGGFGAALLSSLCGLEVIGLWVFDIRPSGLQMYQHSSAVVGLPIVALAATILPPIIVGLAIDERRNAVRSLRFNERRFRESLERSPIGTIIADLDGVWTVTNAALQKMLGYSAEELRTSPAMRFGHPEDYSDIARQKQLLLSGKANFYEAERRYLHKDGSWIWVRVAVSLVRDEDGHPLHFIGQVESLEARRRAERDLAEERERLKTTLRAIADAVITTDGDGRITYLNAAAQELLNQSLEHVENRPLNDVMVLTDLRTARASASVLGKCITHGEVMRREEPCALHRPDGGVRYVTEAASPVFNAEGNVTGTVIVLRDATANYEQNRELSHRATHDVLTGLANRFEFERRTKELFERARHLQRSVALLAVDLDRFKAVNDAGGHAAGDAVLRRVAAIFRSIVRHSDTVARVGGDEFVLVLDSCTVARASAVGRQILGALNPLQVEWEGALYRIGASIGTAMFAQDYDNVAAWVAAADHACYEAKRDGGGKIRFAQMAAAAPETPVS